MRASARSSRPKLAGSSAREKVICTPPATALLRGSGETASIRTGTTEVVAIAQSTESALVPALPARSRAPRASRVSS